MEGLIFTVFAILFYVFLVGLSVFTFVAFLYSIFFTNMHQNSGINKLQQRTELFIKSMDHDMLSTQQTPQRIENVKDSGLIMANVTMGASWAQVFFAGFKSLIGGKIDSYKKVLTHGRNEALQRLREQAIAQGWSEVINVRIETSSIMANVDKGKQGGFFEVIAYGTGIK